MIFHEPQLWWYPERPTRLEPTPALRPWGNALAPASATRSMRAAAPAGCSTQRRAQGIEALVTDSLA